MLAGVCSWQLSIGKINHKTDGGGSASKHPDSLRATCIARSDILLEPDLMAEVREPVAAFP